MRVLFFSPFANIWDHSIVEHGIANALSEAGDEVFIVGCEGEMLPQCIATQEARIDFGARESEIKKVCQSCQKRRKLLLKNFETSKSLSLDSYISNSENATINSFLTEINRDNYMTFEFNGLPIGQIAFFETALTYKLRTTEIVESIWSELLHQVKNAMKVATAIENILKSTNPERIIVHNSLFSVNRVVWLVAKAYGIPCYSIGASQNWSQRQSSISLFSSPEDWIALSKSDEWNQFINSDLSHELDFEKCESHFIETMVGNDPFTYSSGVKHSTDENVREFFGISRAQKVCLATLSSEDEFFAANIIGVVPDFTNNSNYFKSQFEWIEFLFEFFQKNPELSLIIRVHPREFPNKRDQIMAESAQTWRELFKQKPLNVHINWPDDNLSIYQIAGITDLLLNWRSTVGVEFQALGIPVLVPDCSNLLSYPNELNSSAHSLEEYSASILKLVQNSWSIEYVREAYQWITFLSNYVARPSSSTKRAPENFTLRRPKSPGMHLNAWNFLVRNFLNYAPLFLERRNLGKWNLPHDTLLIIRETLNSAHPSLASVAIDKECHSNAPYSDPGLYQELASSLLKRLSLMYEDPINSEIWKKYLTKLRDSRLEN